MKTITTENTGGKVILMEQITTKIRIKAFGITKEILAGREVMLSFEGQTVADLRAHLFAGYPALASLRSLLIAVNNSYAEDSLVISMGDEVALIPPVSGG
jgi:sulfur-carrier protein